MVFEELLAQWAFVPSELRFALLPLLLHILPPYQNRRSLLLLRYRDWRPLSILHFSLHPSLLHCRYKIGPLACLDYCPPALCLWRFLTLLRLCSISRFLEHLTPLKNIKYFLCQWSLLSLLLSVSCLFNQVVSEEILARHQSLYYLSTRLMSCSFLQKSFHWP